MYNLLRSGKSRKELNMLRIILICLLLPVIAYAGDDYSEPKRGTATRAALMDATRPHAIWNLGGPIEFVVEELRQQHSIAYAVLHPQRPGGVAINFFDTPFFQRGDIDPEFYDGVTMHVLYQKSGDTWVAVHWSIGATDVWFASPEFCADYHSVIPEFCA